MLAADHKDAKGADVLPGESMCCPCTALIQQAASSAPGLHWRAGPDEHPQLGELLGVSIQLGDLHTSVTAETPVLDL